MDIVTELETIEGVMEVEESLLQAAAEDILEEYFPRPKITKPPPQVPEIDRSMKQVIDFNGFQGWGKRANRDQGSSSLHAIPVGDDGCCHSEGVGMTDEEIKAFLSSRLKRGKGNVGSHEASHLSDNGGGGGGVLGSRTGPDVWSRLDVVSCYSKPGAEVWQLLELSDPVIAWKKGVFGTKKRIRVADSDTTD